MFYFTAKDQLRLDVLTRYSEGEIHLEHALTTLEIGERQFRRLFRRFRADGIISIKHGNTGQTPHNKIPRPIEDKIILLFKTKYKGFNVTHFREKLEAEMDKSLVPSYTALRRILKESGHLTSRRPRHKRVHRPRERYEKEGLFVQIDGSHHVWFGDQETCLIAIIDDATSKILAARFSPAETTLDTMKVAENVVKKYGRFHIIYSDKAGIFGDGKRANFTNFKRSMKQLDILPILAHSAQAKGRIERLFKTLQDRLISEMRLNKIDNMTEANQFLEKYIEEHNDKFSIEAKSPELAYRILSKDVNLKEIFCEIEIRTVHTGNVILFENNKYIIQNDYPISLKGRWVEIRTYQDGLVKFYLENEEMKVIKLDKYHRKAA